MPPVATGWILQLQPTYNRTDKPECRRWQPAGYFNSNLLTIARTNPNAAGGNRLDPSTPTYFQ
ncbi:MAG: hypothetical protein ACREDR_29700, partial [Blastocatellia bacterium]